MTKDNKGKVAYIQFKMTPDYKERIIREANRQDMNYTDFIKSCLNKVLPKKEK